MISNFYAVHVRFKKKFLGARHSYLEQLAMMNIKIAQLNVLLELQLETSLMTNLG